MTIYGKKGLTPEETAAIVSAAAIAKGKDVAQSAIVSILGCGRPFVRVHVGLTDVDLGKSLSDRAGYSVAALYTASSQHTTAAVKKVVSDWLSACHGKRHEAAPERPVLKPGTKTLYLAVAYGAKADSGKAG
jgi:hypothetical protein